MPKFEDYLKEFEIMIAQPDHSPEETASMARLCEIESAMEPNERRKIYQFFTAMLDRAQPQDPDNRSPPS